MKLNIKKNISLNNLAQETDQKTLKKMRNIQSSLTDKFDCKNPLLSKGSMDKNNSSVESINKKQAKLKKKPLNTILNLDLKSKFSKIMKNDIINLNLDSDRIFNQINEKSNFSTRLSSKSKNILTKNEHIDLLDIEEFNYIEKETMTPKTVELESFIPRYKKKFSYNKNNKEISPFEKERIDKIKAPIIIGLKKKSPALSQEINSKESSKSVSINKELKIKKRNEINLNLNKTSVITNNLTPKQREPSLSYREIPSSLTNIIGSTSDEEYQLNLNYIFDSLKKISDENSHLSKKGSLTVIKFNSRKIDLNLRNKTYSSFQGIIDKTKLNSIGGSLFEINFDFFEFIELLNRLREDTIKIEQEYKSKLKILNDMINDYNEKESRNPENFLRKDKKIETLNSISKAKGNSSNFNNSKEEKSIDNPNYIFQSNLSILKEFELNTSLLINQKKCYVIDDICEECRNIINFDHVCSEGKWSYQKIFQEFPNLRTLVETLCKKIKALSGIKDDCLRIQDFKNNSRMKFKHNQ